MNDVIKLSKDIIKAKDTMYCTSWDEVNLHANSNKTLPLLFNLFNVMNLTCHEFFLNDIEIFFKSKYNNNTNFN